MVNKEIVTPGKTDGGITLQEPTGMEDAGKMSSNDGLILPDSNNKSTLYFTKN